MKKGLVVASNAINLSSSRLIHWSSAKLTILKLCYVRASLLRKRIISGCRNKITVGSSMLIRKGSTPEFLLQWRFLHSPVWLLNDYVWRGKEDGHCGDDGEQRENEQTDPVYHHCRKFPIGHCIFFKLLFL